MLERRTHFHADVLSDCIFAVGGGTLLGTLTCTVEFYQPAHNKWEFAAPFPTPIADHTGKAHKGILYISGGFSGGKTLRDTYSYLPRLCRWVGNSAMASTCCDHGMAAVQDRIFCVGGRTLKEADKWIPVSEMECYFPDSNQWTMLTSTPLSCCHFSITAHGTKLCLTGGASLQRMQKEDGVFLYETAGQIWKKASPLPKALAGYASCMIKRAQVNAADEMRTGTKSSPLGRRRKSALSSFTTKKQDYCSAPEKE